MTQPISRVLRQTEVQRAGQPATVATQPTSTTSPALSQQALQQVQPDEEQTNYLSLYRNCPPATATEIMPFVLRLAVNFPAMNTAYTTPNGEKITFWTVLADQVASLGWSVERTRYAVDYMLRNCPYREFRVAEFLQLDQRIEPISDVEFSLLMESQKPHAPIVRVSYKNGKWAYFYKSDADRAGITNYQRRYTPYEASRMTPAEREQCGIYSDGSSRT